MSASGPLDTTVTTTASSDSTPAAYSRPPGGQARNPRSPPSFAHLSQSGSHGATRSPLAKAAEGPESTRPHQHYVVASARERSEGARQRARVAFVGCGFA